MMSTPLFMQEDLEIQYLSADESHHAMRVLRLRQNDSISLTDGQGHWCKAVITSADERRTVFRITEKNLIPRRTFSIHLAIAPTKNIDRMEWMVEKCTEIGIEKISFVHCKTSERPSVPMDRIKKVVISAMKQSKQVWLPEITDMVPLQRFLTAVGEPQCFIAHADDSNPGHLIAEAKPGGGYVLLVGPEGDFTREEVTQVLSSGFKQVSLGPNRLRTETAGLFGVAALVGINAVGKGITISPIQN